MTEKLNLKRRNAFKGEARQFAEQIACMESDELGEECILWPFGVAGNGYGALHLGNTQFTHHRGIWILKHGPLDKKTLVRHKCGVPLCCNPNHHELGSSKQNSEDRKKHGTYPATGEKSSHALITDAQAIEIHQKVREGVVRTEVAKEYGVSKSTVNHIAGGFGWTHLELEPIDGFVVGEKSHYAKLTESEVRQLHKEYGEGKTGRELAVKYGVTLSNIRMIVVGKTWKHLGLGRARK